MMTSFTLCIWCTDNSRQRKYSSEFSPPAHAPAANENDFVQSMLIRGLPDAPPQSVHMEEASKQVRKFVERWQNIKSLESYCHFCLSLVSYLYSGVVTAERLAIVAIFYALNFVIDDVLFDRPDEDSLANEYGISSSIRESPQKIGEFIEKLNVIIRQENRPVDPTPIERMWWESGRDFRRLGPSEWCNAFFDTLVAHHKACVASLIDNANERIFLQDLDSYSQMRLDNCGASWGYILLEFSHAEFLPHEVREQATMIKLRDIASIQVGFVNDIFSYPKELVSEENGNSHNLIKFLMESEGILQPQAVSRAVNLVNSYNCLFEEVESTQLPVTWKSEPWASSLHRYVEAMKLLMSGHIFWYTHVSNKRYNDPAFNTRELKLAIINSHVESQQIYAAQID
jgi:hypothetical protein